MDAEHVPSVPVVSPEASGLPATLAGRVRFWRERRMLSPELLALKSHLPLRLIEDIESGLETFLSPATRQRLARALHIQADRIREVEKPPQAPLCETASLRQAGFNLHEAILRDPSASHPCPACGAPLNIRLFERRDLHGSPLEVIKASCVACLFRLADD